MIKKFISYLGLLLIPVFFFFFFWRKNELKENPRYTITKTIREFRTLKAGLQIEHCYYVNGKKFVETFNKDERLRIVYPNGRYLVKFSSKYPSMNEVFWNKPVPDSIRQAPADGWDTPPF